MNTKLKFLGFYMIVSLVSFFLSTCLQQYSLENYQIVLLVTLVDLIIAIPVIVKIKKSVALTTDS